MMIQRHVGPKTRLVNKIVGPKTLRANWEHFQKLYHENMFDSFPYTESFLQVVLQSMYKVADRRECKKEVWLDSKV